MVNSYDIKAYIFDSDNDRWVDAHPDTNPEDYSVVGVRLAESCSDAPTACG